MNQTEVTKEGLKHVRPGREATTGVNVGPGGGKAADAAPGTRRASRGEQATVPDAEFRSYYGKPIINQPVWEAPDIPGYLFVGGLGGASSIIAAGAHLSGRERLARAAKIGAAVSGALSTVALVHDLGRRGRFLNMLRTFKPTSPMSVGSWVLASYAPAATIAALSDVTGIAPFVGGVAATSAAIMGMPLATYTAALISNTAVPAWHDGYREMPFLFAASAATSGAGFALVSAPVEECAPVRLLGAVAGAGEILAQRAMRQRMGLSAEAFEEGKAKRYHQIAEPLLVTGVLGSILGKKSRLLSIMAGGALLVGSALTRFSIFEAGLASAADPRYTVVPQRQRLEAGDGRPTPAREEQRS